MMFERLFTPFAIGLLVVCFGCGPSGNPADLSLDEDYGVQVDANDSAVDQDAPDGTVFLDIRDSEDMADVFVDVADVSMQDARDVVPDDFADDEMNFDVPMDEGLSDDKDLIEVDQVDVTDATELDAEDVLDISDVSTPDDTSTDSQMVCTPVTAQGLCYGDANFNVPNMKVFQPGEEALVLAYAADCCNPIFEFVVPDLGQATVVLVTETVLESCESYWTVTEPELCGDTLSMVAEFHIEPMCIEAFTACALIQLDARATNFVLKP